MSSSPYTLQELLQELGQRVSLQDWSSAATLSLSGLRSFRDAAEPCSENLLKLYLHALSIPDRDVMSSSTQSLFADALRAALSSDASVRPSNSMLADCYSALTFYNLEVCRFSESWLCAQRATILYNNVLERSVPMELTSVSALLNAHFHQPLQALALADVVAASAPLLASEELMMQAARVLSYFDLGHDVMSRSFAHSAYDNLDSLLAAPLDVGFGVHLCWVYFCIMQAEMASLISPRAPLRSFKDHVPRVRSASQQSSAAHSVFHLLSRTLMQLQNPTNADQAATVRVLQGMQTVLRALHAISHAPAPFSALELIPDSCVDAPSCDGASVPMSQTLNLLTGCLRGVSLSESQMRSLREATPSPRMFRFYVSLHQGMTAQRAAASKATAAPDAAGSKRRSDDSYEEEHAPPHCIVM